MTSFRGREDIEQEERERLAPYAICSGESQGRLIPEPEHAYRSVFQRDRDRIIHSLAFRRLEYKTQVFVFHEGDHYRNRLTHTIEGAQIARTMARALRVNEDLAEAISLAHDLGHTPFGHAGERVLAGLMSDDGGFDHNRQSLRIVDLLEDRYPEFPGLNLCAETREGILKHGCRWPHPVEIPKLGVQRSIEGQIADLADEIAYTNHDLDDGLRSGLITPEMLDEFALWRLSSARVADRVGGAAPRIVLAQTIVALIDALVTDALRTSAERLDRANIASVNEVRSHREPLTGYSPDIESGKRELKRFLLEHFYRHPRVTRASDRAEGVMGDLFRYYRSDPDLLPRVPEPLSGGVGEGDARRVADYVACMTDRFAISEHTRLMDSHGHA